MNKSQIKSKIRVAEHGEVFTNQREVRAMCDLVENETFRIDSRILEPACGDGNFLIEILARKLKTISALYKGQQTKYESNAFLALSSVYGIDIMEDNVIQCRERLTRFCVNEYKKVFKLRCNLRFREICEYILSKNIIHGDALTIKKTNGEPIVFTQWALVNNMFSRTDFKFEDLLQVDRFGETIEAENGSKVAFPVPIREYPMKNIWNINQES